MKKKHKEMIGRIFLGIIVLSILIVVIVPKPQKQATSTIPSASLVPQKNVVVVHTVTLTSKGFEPQKITVKKGEVVTWSNKSGKSASVNSADYPANRLFPILNIGGFEDGENIQARIYKTGELRYVNNLNPKQIGTITVTE